MAILKKITASETYSVRLPVLRKGKPIESCHFEGDNSSTTIHFGLYLNPELVGVVSLFKKTNPLFPKKNQFQIRGMAVLENHRKKDFGKALLLHCEAECKNQDVDLIWFNARTEAAGFYEKMGYRKTGLPFEIPDVGEHVIMFKEIKNE